MIDNKKSWLLSCSILIAALVACAKLPTKAVFPEPTQRIDLSSELYLRQIGDGVYVITNTFPWAANSVLVKMADGTLVMAGTPYTPEATSLVLDWVKKQYGKHKMIAIDTGYHVDNMGGNQALIEAGIPVYGSDMTARLILERGEANRQSMLAAIGDPQSPAYKAELEMKYLPPDHIFPIANGLTLTYGGEELRVIYPGPSQAPDKVAIYFPDRKLLFGSCMIVGLDRLGNTIDADMKNWPDAVRILQQYPVDVVVPGHGERLDPGLIQHTLDLLASNP
jgi:metallo-beta-lactamase class B